jgi:histidine ammonia-lyase
MRMCWHCDIRRAFKTWASGCAGISRAAGLIEAAHGKRTQGALSLRSVPHAYGAARNVFDTSCAVVDRELASVTDNPAVAETPDAPVVSSQAYAVAPALCQAADNLAIALAQVAAMSERLRIAWSPP